jgi:hypothetical protein
MSRLFDRAHRVPADVLARAALTRGERVLAGATADDGTWLLGTRDALVVLPAESPASPGSTGTTAARIPWERIASADWERDEERLRVHEVGEFGQQRPVHVFALTDPGPLLPMVRERVTASVLLSRRVLVRGRKGLRVVARRPPRGRGDITWTYELDPGVDPEDPLVREAAEVGLRDAERELGDQQSLG